MITDTNLNYNIKVSKLVAENYIVCYFLEKIKSMQLRFKSLLACIACLLASSCGDIWLGDDKALNLKGERISLVAKSNDLTVIKTNKTNKIGAATKIVSWPVSGANFKQAASNIAINNISDNYESRIGFSTSSDIAVSSEPIIIDDRIYMINANGIIVASGLDGSEVWSNNFFQNLNKKSFFDFFSSNFVSGGLSYADGTIYATGGYNVIVAIDEHSGKVIWNTKLSSPTRSAPIKINNNSVLVQTIDNKIFSLDSLTGEILWAHFGINDDLSILSGFSLDVYKSKITFQYSTGEIFVVNSITGDEIWNDTVSSPLDSSYNEGSLMRVASAPLIIDGMVISYGGDGYAAAFDLETGKNIWKKELAISKPFWVSGDLMFGLSKSSTLFAADVKTGNVLWIYELSQHNDGETKHYHWTSPIMVNGQILSISSKGLGVMLEAYSGRLIKSLELPTDVISKPIAISSGLYITSNDGYIYKY